MPLVNLSLDFRNPMNLVLVQMLPMITATGTILVDRVRTRSAIGTEELILLVILIVSYGFYAIIKSEFYNKKELSTEEVKQPNVKI